MISILKRILYFSNIERKTDVLSVISVSHKVFLSEINIDGNCAAFCEGFRDRKGTLTIVRVATNSDYYKYSPGQILLIDTIENIKDSVQYFDLTRGTEEYKFKLGGIVHHNYCYYHTSGK